VICIVKFLFSGLINGNMHYPQGEVKPEIGASVFFLALRGDISTGCCPNPLAIALRVMLPEAS
jgi:hypothetical protein